MRRFLKISYSTKIFILIVAILTLCEGAFVAFQYHREQRYREELLNAQLTVLNYQLLDHYEGGVLDVELWERTIDLPIRMLQFAIFDMEGNMLYDNTGIGKIDDIFSLTEIKQAAESEDHKGYSVHNNDEVDDDSFYYYSALREGDLIARTGAMGHEVALSEFMQIDRTFMWYAIIIYLLIAGLSYIITSQSGRTITRLSNFAQKAENGEEIYDTEAFPRNELGNIAHNIILLYMKLQRTMADRDRQAAIAKREEEEKAQMRKELTNNINHELKTPITAISLEIETYLMHKDRLSEAQKEMLLTRCKANSDRLLQMVKDILTLNRLDDGASAIQKEHLSLRDVVDDVVSAIEPKAFDAGFEIHVDLPETMMMLGNAPLLESIFNNLINNAINYSGGCDINIFLQYEDENSYRVIVSDNGVGIGEEHFEHLFDRFYRLESGRMRKHGGTGIGLAIVKSAAIFHGGSVTVRNVPSGGLEFTIVLAKGAKYEPSEEEDTHEE